MDDAKIKAAFNDACEKLRAKWKTPDILPQVEKLMAVFDGVRAAGIAIHPEFVSSPSRMMMDLGWHGSEANNVVVGGILHIGGCQHLFSLDAPGAYKKKNYMHLRLSQNDIRLQGATFYKSNDNGHGVNEIAGNCYDVLKEEEWEKFQRDIIALYARHVVTNELVGPVTPPARVNKGEQPGLVL